ncbi:MAG: hypothetical protein GY750_01395 [Lentisphaerae bacterium]|nr:hypothetical protein [Lentisphaerota bacterium]MCP4100074.1 hypothetical protein [Lentisphaerota bacterium]
MNILKKSVTFLFLAFMFATALQAGSIPFRLGRIYAAEITRSRVYVSGLKDTTFKTNFSSKAYAMVAVRLQPGRSLSIYDFALRIDGTEYPCVGLRSGSSSFSYTKWKQSSTSTGEFYSMLFIVNASDINSSAKNVKGTLVYKLKSGGKTETAIPFKNIRYSSLTSSSDIPAKGMFNKSDKGKSPN